MVGAAAYVATVRGGNSVCLNEIKSKGRHVKREGKALVSCNNNATYTMADVPPLPDYKVVLPKGQFNSICAHYNICTDPNLGMGWAVRCIGLPVAVGHARINLRGRLSHASTSMCSHATW